MIIVGGFGRCGTGLVTSAISTANYTFISDLNDKYYWSDGGTLYKTHSMPPTEWPSGAKVIWCFGNPMNVIVSCFNLGKGFLRQHGKNLGADPNYVENAYFEDVLGLDKHFTAWYNANGVRLATVKYETLFENQYKIQRFVGLPMRFPKPKSRESNWQNHHMAKELERTYGELAARIEAAEDFKVW